MSNLREDLLTDIDSYCATAGMKETTFGRLAVNDGKFVGRLRGGKDITVGTLERIRIFIAAGPHGTAASNDTEPGPAPSQPETAPGRAAAPASSALTKSGGM